MNAAKKFCQREQPFSSRLHPVELYIGNSTNFFLATVWLRHSCVAEIFCCPAWAAIRCKPACMTFNILNYGA
jgi:hypothetical protein